MVPAKFIKMNWHNVKYIIDYAAKQNSNARQYAPNTIHVKVVFIVVLQNVCMKQRRAPAIKPSLEQLNCYCYIHALYRMWPIT